MKREIQVDVAILGAGTAGLTARRSAEQAGATAVLIDPGPYGTTCARIGCMPSKLLIAAADAAYHVRHAAVFGVHAAEPRIDGREVMKRVQALRDLFAGSVVESIEAIDAQGKLIRGRGQLIDRNTIEVDGHTRVTARSIIIATGSSPITPQPFRGLPAERVLTNDQIFELEELPESLYVVGAGVIGLELGQAFHRLGVRVRVGGLRGGVGPLRDPKVLAVAKEVFSGELDIMFDQAAPTAVRMVEGGVEVTAVDEQGRARTDVYEKVLSAAGRVPNVRGFGLEVLDLPVDAQGVPLHNHNTMQVGDTNIFLAGDISAHLPLLHEAADEGRIAGANAAQWPAVLSQPRTTPLAVAFTDPNIAVVGRPWDTMQCDTFRVGTVDYGKQGRARAMAANRGIVNIYGEVGTGLLVGAEMFGPGVEHTAHLLAWAIQSRMTVEQALGMPFYHPVLEEGIRAALRELQTQLKRAHKAGDPCSEFGPGT